MGRATGKIHAAKVDRSERLQRMLLLLKQGGEFTTREVQSLAHICNVSAAASELRQNGHDINCRRDRGLYLYSLGGAQ